MSPGVSHGCRGRGAVREGDKLFPKESGRHGRGGARLEQGAGSLHAPGMLSKVELPDTGACFGLESGLGSKRPVEDREGLRLRARHRSVCEEIVTDGGTPVTELSLREWPRSVAVPFLLALSCGVVCGTVRRVVPAL